jgi:hypothetical protein
MKAAVTFGEFDALARLRGWTAASLADRFRGKIEQPRDFFERVMRPRSGPGSADRSGTLIPYKSVMEFYHSELKPLMAKGSFRACDCGCDKPLYGRKKLASAACRKRMERRRSQTPESSSEKVNKHKGFSVTFQGGR